MTYQQPSSPVAAGWYPDPSGAPQNRWWDGTRWSEATQPTQQPAVVPYSHSVPAYAQLSDVNPVTPFAWGLALVPVIGLIDLVVYIALGGFNGFSATGDIPERGLADNLSTVFSFLSYIAYVALGVLDNRELKQRGLPQPFAWGWAFLPPVYIIGRAVVAFRRTRKGLAPLFVWIGLVIFNWLTGVIIGVVLAASMFSELSNTL